MAEYIERETLTLLAYKSGDYGHPAVVDLEDIADIPAANVVPVVHGRWIEKRERDTFRGYVHYYQCSQCGRVENHKELYCHCGARMDGE